MHPEINSSRAHDLAPDVSPLPAGQKSNVWKRFSLFLSIINRLNPGTFHEHARAMHPEIISARAHELAPDASPLPAGNGSLGWN